MHYLYSNSPQVAELRAGKLLHTVGDGGFVPAPSKTRKRYVNKEGKRCWVGTSSLTATGRLAQNLCTHCLAVTLPSQAEAISWPLCPEDGFPLQRAGGHTRQAVPGLPEEPGTIADIVGSMRKHKWGRWSSMFGVGRGSRCLQSIATFFRKLFQGKRTGWSCRVL